MPSECQERNFTSKEDLFSQLTDLLNYELRGGAFTQNLKVTYAPPVVNRPSEEALNAAYVRWVAQRPKPPAPTTK